GHFRKMSVFHGLTHCALATFFAPTDRYFSLTLRIPDVRNRNSKAEGPVVRCVVLIGSAPGSGAHGCRAGAAILRADAAGAPGTRDVRDCSTYCLIWPVRHESQVACRRSD